MINVIGKLENSNLSISTTIQNLGVQMLLWQLLAIIRFINYVDEIKDFIILKEMS